MCHDFLDRASELRRLDALLAHPGAFAVIWGRRGGEGGQEGGEKVLGAARNFKLW